MEFQTSPDIDFIGRTEKKERLDIGPNELKRIISKILSESKLSLLSIEETRKGAILAKSTDALGKPVLTVVRAEFHIEGVEEDIVEELYGERVENRAKNAIYITSSYFTKSAQEFAKDKPIKLVNGDELTEILAQEDVKISLAFVSLAADKDAQGYFESQRSRKIGMLGTEEKIEDIDRRYAPVGRFYIKGGQGKTESLNHAYINMNTGALYYVQKNKIRQSDVLQRILDLPEKSRERLLDLIENGSLPRENIDDRHLDILEKKGLISRGKTGGGSITKEPANMIVLLVDELLEAILSKHTRTDTSLGESQIGNVSASVEIPFFDSQHNLEHFIETAGYGVAGFDIDETRYKMEDVDNVLEKITGREIEFDGIVYLPYYRCRYSTSKGRVTYRNLVSPKYKSIVAKKTEYTGIYKVIEEVPYLPYIPLGLGYLLYNIENIAQTLHVFASAFIFLVMTVIFGVMLKLFFRTERQVPFYNNIFFKYGFPSLHTMASIGIIGFAFFVNPIFGLILAPVGLFYGYARVRFGAHTVADVLAGAVAGLIVGILCGLFVYPVQMPAEREIVLAAILVLTPVAYFLIARR